MEPDSDEVSIQIAASPERVWQIVSDIGAMGDRSPVCRQCEWLDGGDRPGVGARFLGRNSYFGIRWTRECEIRAWDPPRELAFQTVNRGVDEVLWRYLLEATADGCRVTESYRVNAEPWYVRALHSVPGVHRKQRADQSRGMRRTLEAIKQTAEARPG